MLAGHEIRGRSLPLHTDPQNPMHGYPLTLRFKKLAIAQQFAVESPEGRLLMYVRQKAFKLKEAITVYADREQSRPLYRIEADRIIDFSATYRITDAEGSYIGEVRRRGMRSIWRARYDIHRHDDVVFSVREENPWAKVMDSLVREIPVISLLSGYVFHPRYRISTSGGGDVLRLTKRPAFLESLFDAARLDTPLGPDDERLLLIGMVTTVLLERSRG